MIHRRHRTAALAALLTATLPLAAAPVGDPEAGRAKAEPCLGCHAIPNYSATYPGYRVPKLAGQRPEYIVEALKAYRSGARRHPSMQANAAALTDQDIADLAAYLSAAK